MGTRAEICVAWVSVGSEGVQGGGDRGEEGHVDGVGSTSAQG